MKKIFFLITALICSLLFSQNVESKKNIVIQKKITPRLIISSAQGDKDENYILNFPSAVAANEKGNIYIISRENNKISVFDSNGKFVKTIGRFGAGPGEFSFAGMGDRIEFFKDTMLINDQRHRRVQVLTEEGRYISQVNPMESNCKSISPIDFNTIILGFNPYKENYTFIHKYQKENGVYQLVKVFGDFIVKPSDIDWSDRVSFLFFSDLNKFLICSDDKGCIYQIYTSVPIIKKYNPDGRLIWQKTIDILSMNKVLDEYNKTWKEEMEFISHPSAEVIKNLKPRIFAYNISFDSSHSRLLILSNINAALLELNLSGELKTVYYPDKAKYERLGMSFENYLINVGFLNGCFDISKNRYLVIVTNSGELWEYKLN
jgi:hypothetical protein